MTTVWPVMVSLRQMVATMFAQSSLSAAFFKSEPAAERSICSGRRFARPRVAAPPTPLFVCSEVVTNTDDNLLILHDYCDFWHGTAMVFD
jgi:hypothetical protein